MYFLSGDYPMLIVRLALTFASSSFGSESFRIPSSYLAVIDSLSIFSFRTNCLSKLPGVNCWRPQRSRSDQRIHPAGHADQVVVAVTQVQFNIGRIHLDICAIAFETEIAHQLLAKQSEGTVDRLYRHWMLGGAAEAEKAPRWSVVRNLLGWVK